MHAWPSPTLTTLPAEIAVPPLRLHDSAAGETLPVAVRTDLSDAGSALDTPSCLRGSSAGMYVCGITPYDSTHLGHAATYLTFDLIHRYLSAAGVDVTYVQNITDVDEPLFERAERDGVDWRDLGDSQIDLFRSDMEALQVIPPQHYIGAIESIPDVITMVGQLLDAGAAYQLDPAAEGEGFADIYVDHTFTENFGYESGYDAETMAQLFAERGGDPTRPGKRHPLDALVWRAAREGEPSWPSPFGAGRPGWHVECAAIAAHYLPIPFSIQGGGSDLRFPHHEFSAAHVEAAHGVERMAQHYVHTGMIGLDGVKMSKSLGNLVFVSQLRAAGHDPSAIRLGVYSQHYRSDRDWSDAVMAEAETRLARWRAAFALAHSLADAGSVPDAALSPATSSTATLAAVLEALAEDLNAPAALRAVDRWAEAVLEGQASDDPALLHRGLDQLFGISIDGPAATRDAQVQAARGRLLEALGQYAQPTADSADAAQFDADADETASADAVREVDATITALAVALPTIEVASIPQAKDSVRTLGTERIAALSALVGAQPTQLDPSLAAAIVDLFAALDAASGVPGAHAAGVAKEEVTA